MIDDTLQRMIDHLLGRASGPMHFRLLMQPTMALFLGIRDGMKDSKESQPAYLWSIFTHPAGRAQLLKSGLKSLTKILIMALVLDAIYQLVQFRWIYPGEGIVVALVLAVIPYSLIRGPANRISSWWRFRRSTRIARHRTVRAR
jgi:hypothetical protein